MAKDKKQKSLDDTLADGFNVMLSENEVNMYPNTQESKKIPLPFQKRDRIPRTPTEMSTASSLATLEDEHGFNILCKDEKRSEESDHSEGHYVEELEEEDEIEAFDGDDEKENENSRNIPLHDISEDSSKHHLSTFGKPNRASMACMSRSRPYKPSSMSYENTASTDLDNENSLAHKCRCTVM